MVQKKYPPSNKHQDAGWPYQQSQELSLESKSWKKRTAETGLDHVKHINPTTRRNPHVWIWNDARINSSGLIIIANLQDVNTKKQVIEILERSGLSQSQINIQSIKICRWRAYIQLKNPKDVIKLNRFSKVRYPDGRDGNLVYILHTPRRAFMKAGNWPLDMLFVIYHDKLKSEYHDILDYTKTIPGDLYYGINAMVKLSKNKTVVVLYRRCAEFQLLAKAPHKVGIKKVAMPNAEDLSELTAILNGKDLDPAKGWKFVRKSTLNPSAKAFYTTTPAPQKLSQHPQPFPLNPDVKYYPAPTSGFGTRWSPVNIDQLPSSLPSPWGSGPFVAPSNVEARLRFMELTSPGWTGAECMIAPRILLSPSSPLPPRPKAIRHILTPLTEALASQNSKYKSQSTKSKTTTKSPDQPVRSNPVPSADWSKLVREANSAQLAGSKSPFKSKLKSPEMNFSPSKKSSPRKRRVVSPGVRRRSTESSQLQPRRIIMEPNSVDTGKSSTSNQRDLPRPRRSKAMRAGTPESSSDVSLKDVQSSDIDFKEDQQLQRSEKVRGNRRIKHYPS
jgi:hypothetical protein